MNKQEIRGATQKGVGAIKEGVGKATGNRKLQAKGMADRAVGATKQAVGKARSAIHKASR